MVCVIAELHMVELHATLQAFYGSRMLCRLVFLLFLQEFEYPLGSRGRGLEHIRHLCRLLDRLREVPYILDKGLDIANLDHILHSEPSAEYHHRHITQIAYKHHNRHHHSR